MAGVDVTGYIVRALREGRPTGSVVHEYRAAGGRIATTTFNRLAASIRRAIASEAETGLAPLNRRPTADEITPLEAKRPGGYLHYVDILTRDRGTTTIHRQMFTVKSRQLLTRQRILDAAIDAFAGAAEDYNQEVLGALPVSTFELVPEA